MCDALLQVAGSWSRFCRRPAYWRFLTCLMQLRGRHRGLYAQSLYEDTTATLDDLREAVSTLEDAGRIARRVLGGAHPVTKAVEHDLQKTRAALRARGGA